MRPTHQIQLKRKLAETKLEVEKFKLATPYLHTQMHTASM